MGAAHGNFTQRLTDAHSQMCVLMKLQRRKEMFANGTQNRQPPFYFQAFSMFERKYFDI